MRIRKDQLIVFEVAAWEQFCSRLPSFIKDEMPFAATSVERSELGRTVQRHASKARELGFFSEAEIAEFVCLPFLPGKPFYTSDEFQDFLRLRTDSKSAINSFMKHLHHELSERVLVPEG